MRIEKLNMVYLEADHEVRIYDFNRMRTFVSDPDKEICLEFKISDLSPMSIVPREQDGIVISDSFQDLWNESRKKTQYLGEHDVFVSHSPHSSAPLLETTDRYHLFYNSRSFIRLEENFSAKGGAFGVETLYLWKENFLNNYDSDNYCDPTKPNFAECQANTPSQSEWVLRGVVTL